MNKDNDYYFIVALAMNHAVVEAVFDCSIRKSTENDRKPCNQKHFALGMSRYTKGNNQSKLIFQTEFAASKQNEPLFFSSPVPALAISFATIYKFRLGDVTNEIKPWIFEDNRSHSN